MTCAVITGDIIASSKILPKSRYELLLQFETFLKNLDRHFKIKSEIFRGDSFQTLVKDPMQALRIALLQKAFVRFYHVGIAPAIEPIDIRIAIGIGAVGLEGKKLNVSSGEAFELSGKLLDRMKAQKMTLAIHTSDHFHSELSTEIYLLNAIFRRTSALQCEVIFHKLFERTEHEIADLLGIKQAAVNQRSRHGDWNAIAMLLNRFENIYAVS